MQLNRFIAQSGLCSRRQAEALVRAGTIKINGTAITEPGYRVQSTDTVTYKGKPLIHAAKISIVLHKPRGYVTTVSDDKNRRTVMDLVDDATRKVRIFPVGRLDYDTTGLLLLTNDGDLAQRLSHPRHEVRKIYRISLDRPVFPEHLQALRRGIRLIDGPIAADHLEVKTAHVIDVTVHSGRNRIVRRMFEFFGYRVTSLERIAYGALSLKGLPRGAWRKITTSEMKRLVRS